MQFSHAHEASIRKIHGQTSVRTLQCHQRVDFVLGIECQVNDTPPNPIKNCQWITAALVEKKLRL